MKNNEKDIIIKCGADKILPFSLVLGLYIILFGTISPGGGFQGGVIVTAAVVLLYFGYGYKTESSVISPKVLHVGESIGAIVYVVLASIALLYGVNFCTNMFFDNTSVGQMISAGNITFMSYTVGFKVLTGIGFLLLLFFGLLNPDKNEDKGGEQ